MKIPVEIFSLQVIPLALWIMYYYLTSIGWQCRKLGRWPINSCHKSNSHDNTTVAKPPNIPTHVKDDNSCLDNESDGDEDIHDACLKEKGVTLLTKTVITGGKTWWKLESWHNTHLCQQQRLLKGWSPFNPSHKPFASNVGCLASSGWECGGLGSQYRTTLCTTDAHDHIVAAKLPTRCQYPNSLTHLNPHPSGQPLLQVCVTIPRKYI